MTCNLHPEMPKKPVPLYNQDPRFLLLHGSQKVQASRLGSPIHQPPKMHRIQAVSTFPGSERALTLPLKTENARFPIEERKAVTCYSTGSTRKPDPQRCTEAQHFTLYLPALESHLSSPRV
jgi:hypothetical protein